MRINLVAMLAVSTIGALIIAGCAKSSDQSQTTTTTTAGTTASQPTTSSGGGPSSAGTAQGSAEHGKQVYGANCAACHGAAGEGASGPSLKSEKTRKDYAQTVAWIRNPQPPMPKLYPSPLSAKDVDDVAAFVQTL